MEPGGADLRTQGVHRRPPHRGQRHLHPILAAGNRQLAADRFTGHALHRLEPQNAATLAGRDAGQADDPAQRQMPGQAQQAGPAPSFAPPHEPQGSAHFRQPGLFARAGGGQRLGRESFEREGAVGAMGETGHRDMGGTAIHREETGGMH